VSDLRELIDLVEAANAGTLVDAAVPEPLKHHLLDAIRHADAYDQGWTLADFEIAYLGLLSSDEIGQHDDLSSWVEVRDADDLSSFRNGEWDQPASVSLPPIIIITAPDEGRCHTQLGDGRGRVNFAVAHGLRLHTYHMVFQGCHTTGTLAEAAQPSYRTVATKKLGDGRTLGKYILKTGETLFIETRPNWRHDDIRFPDYDGTVTLVRAVMDGNKQVGSADFYHYEGDSYGNVEQIAVNADQRRKGVATVMYDHVQHVLGMRAEPSNFMNPDGREFWNNRRG
jgi:hypothetical protein